jgi:hypothetical protein
VVVWALRGLSRCADGIGTTTDPLAAAERFAWPDWVTVPAHTDN